MRSWSRHLAGWVTAIVVVAVLAFALTLRGGSLTVGDSPATPSPSTDAPVAQATVTPRPTAEPTPTIAPTPPPTSAPTIVPATPTPVPVAAAPPATPTPVPGHDDDPVLLTNDRVDGTLGQTLTIGGYSVRAVRVASPAEGQCATILQGGEHFYEITLTYAGPLYSVSFDIGGGISMWCNDFNGDITQQFPSGVTRVVVVAPAENSAASGRPFSVFLTPQNGPHSLWYVFN